MPLAALGLPALVDGVIAAIILYGLTSLFKPLLLGIANHIPLIGGTLARAVNAVLADAGALGNAYARQGVSAVIAPVISPVFWFEHICAGLLNATDDAALGLRFVASTALNQLYALMITTTRALIAAENAAVTAFVDAIYRVLLADIAQTYATLSREFTALEVYTTAALAAETAFAEAELAIATEFVEEEFAAVEVELATAIAGETTFIEAEIVTETALIETEVAAVEAEVAASDAAITAWVQGEIVALETQIEAVQQTVVQYVQAQVTVVQTEITQLEDECLDDLCAGTHDLAKHLRSLMADGWLAILLGYAAWAVADPRGCGGDTADALGPIASAAADATQSIISSL